MSDVRISTHVAKSEGHNNSNFIMIKFYDGLQNLVGTDYVILFTDNEKLFFKPSKDKVRRALKLTDTVNAWAQYEELKSFEGEYPLDYDNFRQMYYVDKAKRSNISRSAANTSPKQNYKPHSYVPYVEEVVPEPEKIVVSTVNVTLAPTRKYDMTVYEGLLQLLKTQIADLNKSGVYATMNTLTSLIQDDKLM